jgi:branched-chain amino acid transport system ATP-binding protein
MALAARPALLVADGAMAGLSSSEVDDILQILFALSARGVGVIMIEQIMCAVMRFSERVVVLASMIGLSVIPARIASTR